MSGPGPTSDDLADWWREPATQWWFRLVQEKLRLARDRFEDNRENHSDADLWKHLGAVRALKDVMSLFGGPRDAAEEQERIAEDDEVDGDPTT